MIELPNSLAKTTRAESVELRKKIFETVLLSKKPVDITTVARSVGRNWQLVRVCLYELALQNMIEAYDERSRWTFYRKATYPAR